MAAREAQGAWRQNELVGSKPPIHKATLTLTLSLITKQLVGDVSQLSAVQLSEVT
jgi:hypothetical protein